VYFLKPDQSLGVKNGTLGTVERIGDHFLTVRLDKDERLSSRPERVTVDIDHYNHLDHGYAATIHKGQGLTVDRSYILASPYMDRHAAYVAGSRHRESADIFYSQERFKHERDLVNTLSRERTKDVTLDYGIVHDDAAAHRPAQKHHEQRQHPQESPQGQVAHVHSVDREAIRAREQARQQEQLAAFRARYEQQHPEKAKAIAEALRPAHEKIALATQKEFYALNRTLENRPQTREETAAMEKAAATVVPQKEVMGYLEKTDPALTRQLRALAQCHAIRQERQEKQHAFQKSRDLSRGRGL
jgi:hypothetical protein